MRLTGGTRRQVREELTRSPGRPPDSGELQQALRSWEDDEVLDREALLHGLQKNDSAVRNVLANKMRTIIRERTIPAPPAEAELRALFRAEGAAYETEPLYDVTLGYFAKVTLSPEDACSRANGVLGKLRQGEEPKDRGDHFPRGPVFSKQTRSRLERVLKADLGTLLTPERQGSWVHGRPNCHREAARRRGFFGALCIRWSSSSSPAAGFRMRRFHA